MITIKGKIDNNDLARVLEKHGDIVACAPAPFVNGRPHFHVSQFLKRSGEIVSIFHSKPVYYEARDKTMRPLSEVTLYHGNKNIVLNDKWTDMHPRYLAWLAKRQRLLGSELNIPSRFNLWAHETIHNLATGHIGLTTTNYYPDPHTESTSVDGFARSGPLSTNWATLRNSAGDDQTNDSAASGMGTELMMQSDSVNWRNHSRSFFLFDTSAIGSGTTITSATCYIKLETKQAATSWTNDAALAIVAPASNTSLTANDLKLAAWTMSAISATADWDSETTGTYVDFAISDVANVSKTGITKYGLVNYTHDLSNSEPGSGGSFKRMYSTVYFADSSGTTSDPYLEVVTPASGPATLKTFDTVAAANVKTINGVAIASVKTINTAA